MEMKLKKIAVMGGGCYGTALAQCFSNVSEVVKIVEKNPKITESINEQNENRISLPNIKLNSNISCTDNDVLDAELILIAVPVNFIKEVCTQIKNWGITAPIISCSKGFDLQKNQLISDLLEENLNNEIFALSGPSFAAEIAKGFPAKVNLAGKNFDLCQKIADTLSSENFRVEPIRDYIGLQIAGGLKNVLAIGCGILYQKNLGQSAISRFIVQGIQEMISLAEAMGGDVSTFTKIGALGDVILTCTSLQSRNMSFGKFLAEGGKLENWNGALAEGVFASQFLPKIPLKTFQKIRDVIYGKIGVEEFIKNVFL